ncbi:DUF302 domain-containing protein [Rhodanobacter lindaniclasticus]
MYYVAETSKSFDEAAGQHGGGDRGQRLRCAARARPGTAFRSKGVAFERECKVFEVSASHQRQHVLAVDMRLNMALPCRMSVYTEAGGTRIGVDRAGGDAGHAFRRRHADAGCAGSAGGGRARSRRGPGRRHADAWDTAALAPALVLGLLAACSRSPGEAVVPPSPHALAAIVVHAENAHDWLGTVWWRRCTRR